MRLIKDIFIIATSLLLLSSCSKDESEDLLPASKSIVVGQCSVGSFTASMSCTFKDVDKTDIALGQHGVLYCTKADGAEQLFRAWLEGDDKSGCMVWDRSTVSAETMTCVIDGLTPDTKYSYCFFLQKRDGTRSISSVSDFKTQVFNPEIKSVVIKDVKCFSATAEGDIVINDNDAASCDIGIIVSTQPDCNIDNSMAFSSSDSKAIIGINGLDADRDYYCRSYIRYPVSAGKNELIYGPECSFRTRVIVAEAVDLGLSVKWATCNVGALRPYDYGEYYAWGETEPKTNYNWSNYKWCNGSSTTLTKYNTNSSYGTVDNKTGLEFSDDVAHVKWGGSWRMPTKDEFIELLNNCTWTWTTLNGVNGYRVTSKKSGYTDRFIFLPAARCRTDTSSVDTSDFGDYWSSSLETDGKNIASDAVLALRFNSVILEVGYCSRNFGRSARPVCP